MSNGVILDIDLARLRGEDFLREAEAERLIAQARQRRERGPRPPVRARIGQLLLTLGAYLDETRAVPPQISVNDTP